MTTSAPTERMIGFRAGFSVIGRLGNDHVIQVKPATPSTSTSPA